jgi:hypothetical protein
MLTGSLCHPSRLVIARDAARMPDAAVEDFADGLIYP